MHALPALVALLLLATAAGAQEVEDSTVSGTLVSRSATIAAGETSAELYRVPSEARFILTQACTQALIFAIAPFPRPISTSTGPTLEASELGTIPLASGCTSFHPGIALAPDEQLSCKVLPQAVIDTSCLVTGVLQSDEDRGRGRGPR